MDGRRQGPENADDREDREPEPLLEQHRASERGDRRRWLRFAPQARQQAKAVEERDSDHRQEQQDLQTQQSAIGCANQRLGASDQQQRVERAGRGKQRNRGVSHLREARHHVARDRNPSRARWGPRPSEQPGQRNQPAEPQPRSEQMHHLIDLMDEPGRPLALYGMPDPAQADQQQRARGRGSPASASAPRRKASADQREWQTRDASTTPGRSWYRTAPCLSYRDRAPPQPSPPYWR